MMISYIFTPCPLCGIVIILIFIIGGIINGLKNLGRKMEAYQKGNGIKQKKECGVELKREKIEIANKWSEGEVHLAIAFYEPETRLYHAKVINGRTYNSVFLVARSKKEIEEKIDETYKRFDSKKNE